MRHALVRTRFWLWSFRNWLRGYQFRPVQRFRCCEHTTPVHYSWCSNAREASDAS